MNARAALASASTDVDDQRDTDATTADVREFEPVELHRQRHSTRAEWATVAGLAATLVAAAAALAPRVL